MKSYFNLFGLLLVVSFHSNANTETFAQPAGLIGTTWTGEAKSGDGQLTYVFRFTQNSLFLESTCHVAEVSSTLKSDLIVSYSENGNTVELKSGVKLAIPAGKGTCPVNFPEGLKFQLVQDQIFLEYGGTRRLTQLKRQN